MLLYWGYVRINCHVYNLMVWFWYVNWSGGYKMSETYECLEFSKTHLSGVSNQRGSINIPLVVIVQVVALLKIIVFLKSKLTNTDW